MTETPTGREEFPQPLQAYGWTAERAAAWDAHAAEALAGAADGAGAARPGRVTRVDRGECDVMTERGPERVLSDSQRTQGDLAPATGDWVAVVDDAEVGPVIAAILPRHTAMVRRDPGPTVTEQVLVANVELVVVVHALDQPFSPARLERFLVLAIDSGAEAAVVLTKADLGDPGPVADAVADLIDAPIVVTAAPTGTGIDELRRLTTGRTVVFIGLSGSGKSTLTNALVGDDVAAIAQVRDVDARGRHTTTRRELFLVPGGGVLIDTPGVRAIGLWDAWAAVDRVYADISGLAAGCRFGDCAHGHEPGCAVTAAVEDGTLEAARLSRYRDLLAELTELDEQIEERDRRRRRRPSGGR